KMFVVLIPDEYQVNDLLYERLMAEKLIEETGRYDRNRPQREIQEFCSKQGLSVLDLLPVLRDAERKANTYHIQDTHWNMHGHDVAARAIADALSQCLEKEKPKQSSEEISLWGGSNVVSSGMQVSNSTGEVP
ncbi:MAG: hypothetical protein V1918_06340, partial [Planctomycetota bacterium]